MTERVFVCEYLSGGGWRERADEPHAEALFTQGQAMRDAIVADLLQAADCSVGVAVCERGHTLPRGAVPLRARAGESPLGFVARQSALHDVVWLVAPETGGLLAQLQRAVGAGRWLGCSADAIALASSKQATLARLAAHGLPTPLAFAGQPDGGRWVVKPDDGAGSVSTRVHTRHGDAFDDQRLRAQAGARATLEPWIEGEPLSLSLLCTAQHAELLSINRQRMAMDANGMLSFGGVQIDAVRRDEARWRALATLAGQVAHAVPGLRGFVGVDLVWHAGHGPVVIEINPRLTCSYVGLSAALGRNLGAELLAAHRAEAREPARADA